jgi:hypothetical protein
MIPRCVHDGPCLCAARRRLAGKAPVRRRRAGVVAPLPPPFALPGYVVLHLTWPQRGDACPVCGRRVFGAFRCVVYKTTALRPNAHALVAISHVGCAGPPTERNALPLGEPIS